MKRKDIRAGIVYGCAGRLGGLQPVVFLEDGAATLFRREEGRRPRVAVPQTMRPSAGNGYGSPSYGYPVLAIGPDRLVPAEGIDFPAELELVKDGKPPACGLRVALVTSLAAVKGPWDEVIAEREAADAAERERARQRDAELEALRSRMDAVRDRLSALGIEAHATLYDGGSVSLAIGDAERLLAMLPERQEG